MQARLELEVQRLAGELSASERKLELLASDLAAERDRTEAQAGLLERKVSGSFETLLLRRLSVLCCAHKPFGASEPAAAPKSHRHHQGGAKKEPAHKERQMSVRLVCDVRLAAWQEAALEGGLPHLI